MQAITVILKATPAIKSLCYCHALNEIERILYVFVF